MPQRVLIPYRHAKKVKAYEDAARASGVDAVPALTSGRVTLEAFVGLLLMGGTDVNPKLYGEAVQPETEEPDDERDEVELELIDKAIQRDLPILAICRGLQILNVYHGEH
jgi:putative glutamine amidotransferase